MAEANIEVAVEAAVHEAVRSLAMNLLKQHGLRLESVEIEWQDVSSLDASDFIIRNTKITTRKEG